MSIQERQPETYTPPVTAEAQPGWRPLRRLVDAAVRLMSVAPDQELPKHFTDRVRTNPYVNDEYSENWFSQKDLKPARVVRDPAANAQYN